MALRRADLPPVCGPLDGFTGWERHAAYQFLKREQFDIVHASEHLGELFYAIAAKRLGVDFAGTQFWLGCHGPSHWVIEANDEVVRDEFWLWADASERFCLAYADVVWAPSRYLLEWMETEGYVLPLGHTYQQTYHIPNDLVQLRDRSRPTRGTPAPVNELVFFGRIETRKGIKLFLNAIAVLAPELSGIRITFMGRVGIVDGEPADALIARSMAPLNLDWQILSEFDRVEAYTYVTQLGRLVVAAAPVDNSPCAIYELLELEAHFVACRGGGVPELVAPTSHSRVLFDYSLPGITEKLRYCLRHGSVAPEPSMNRSEIESAWVAAHHALAPTAPLNLSAPHSEPVVAIVAHDGNNDHLRTSLESLRACGSAIASVYVLQSDRRGPILIDMELDILPLDEMGHSGVLRRLATVGRSVLVLRAGTVIEKSGLGLMAAAAHRADAVVPLCNFEGIDGGPITALALPGTIAWAVMRGTARHGGIISPSALQQLASITLPGSDILLWFDAALAEGLEVLPLAEPLLDARAAEVNVHQVPDERARLNFWMTRTPPALRLLLEGAYGFILPPAVTLTNHGRAEIDTNAMAQYSALLHSRSLRLGAKLLGAFGRRPSFPAAPSTPVELHAATEYLLRSTAWDLGAPLRLVSRLLRWR
jgi:glycosyltransferase involved in cell wall biosynthesis